MKAGLMWAALERVVAERNRREKEWLAREQRALKALGAMIEEQERRQREGTPNGRCQFPGCGVFVGAASIYCKHHWRAAKQLGGNGSGEGEKMGGMGRMGEMAKG